MTSRGSTGFRGYLPYGESTTAAGSFASTRQRRDGATVGSVTEPSGLLSQLDCHRNSQRRRSLTNAASSSNVLSFKTPAL